MTAEFKDMRVSGAHHNWEVTVPVPEICRPPSLRRRQVDLEARCGRHRNGFATVIYGSPVGTELAASQERQVDLQVPRGPICCHRSDIPIAAVAPRQQDVFTLSGVGNTN